MWLLGIRGKLRKFSKFEAMNNLKRIFINFAVEKIIFFDNINNFALTFCAMI